MVLAEDLKKSILQYAIEGKLTKQLDSDSSVDILLEQIKEEKDKLVKEKKVKKEKKLPLIEDDDIPFDIPKNWRLRRLGDVISLLSGRDFSPDKYNTKEIGIPYITGASNIENNKILINRWTDEPKCIAEKGDLLLVCKGSGYGKTVFMDIEKGHIARQIMAIMKTSLINMEYLNYFLKANFLLIKSKGQGIIPGIDRDSVLLMKFPIPPLEEQQRIVDKINQIMVKIDEYEKIEKELLNIKILFPDEIKKSILQVAMQGQLTEQLETDSSVEDLIKNIKNNYNNKIKEIENDTNFEYPENWKCTKLVNVVDMYTGNSISENIKKTRYTNLEDGYDYIGTKDVGFDHSIDYDNGIKIPFDEPKFKYADKGATLLCIEGGSAGKKIAILEKKVCFGNKLCAFNPFCIDNKYLYYFLQSPVFLNTFMDKMSGMIGGVSINKLKQVTIPLPPIEEQKRIVEKLNLLLPLCEDLKID